MASWLLKAMVQGSIAMLPQGHKINYIFQRNLTKRLRVREPYVVAKIQVTQQHLENYRRVRPNAPALPPDVLELGTGWMPIVPVSLFLSGVDQIRSVDITPLLNGQLIQETLEMMLQLADQGKLAPLLPQLQPDRLNVLRSTVEAARSGALTPIGVLARLHIEVIVADARSLNLPAGSVTFFISNTTLEHIPGDVIEGIFSAFHRIANADAAMSHLIDLTDHYSHLDRNITPYNFLQYSDSTWRWFNNRLQYQSRLRVSDYRQIHAETGYELVIEENTSGTVAQFESVALAAKFQHYSADDAMVTSSWMVSVPISQT